MARHAKESELITRINVTPIIDVALVLVIILLVTAPMLSVADVQVNLPAARSRGAEGERNLSITLGMRGELAIDRDTVTVATLQSRLQERLAQPGNERVLVVIRADTGASYVQVGRILEDVRAAGAQRIAIATRQAVAPQEIEALRRTPPRGSSMPEETR
jgi:biopolymer transport protein ExbD